MKLIFVVLVLSLVTFGCGDGPDSVTCDASSSEFQNIFDDMIANGHGDDVFFDSEIHEYTFSLSESKELCKIGYQSQPGISSTPYLIEILESATGTVVYSNNHVFSSTATSYITLTSVLSLDAGASYTIRRIQTNWGSNIGNTIGRLARKSPMSFPYSNGIMTISSANFYQNGGPSADVGVPYIDLILK